MCLLQCNPAQAYKAWGSPNIPAHKWGGGGGPPLGGVNGIGVKLSVLGYQHPPKSLQNPIFWEDVPKMLPKRAQDGSQGAPDVDFSRIYNGFGILFS